MDSTSSRTDASQSRATDDTDALSGGAGLATAGHTPGPWIVEVEEGYITGRIIVDPATRLLNGRPVQIVGRSVYGEGVQNQRDARLIAAAPDLLAVCIAYRDECRRQGIKFGSINGDADAAIGKATFPAAERVSP